MKTRLILMILITVMVLSIVPSHSFAQAVDSVVVAALPPGNLNSFILGDTLANGARVNPHRVYVLQQTGDVDTVYFLTATIQMKPNVTIVGKTNPKTGHPPVLEPFIAADNSSPGSFFNPMGGDTVTVKNLFFLGTRTDGSSVTGVCFGSGGDTVTYYVDHCVVENIGSSGTPNIVNTWNTQHINLYFTNNEFRNNQDDVPQNPGIAWVDPGTYPLDTAVFVNNTFFVFGGTCIGSGGYCGYIRFEHNTVFMTTKGGAFTIPQLWNSIIRNNIFYGVNSTGLDTAHVYEASVQNANFYTAPAVIELDTLSTLKAAPFNITEAQRSVTVTNNAYFWPPAIVANWQTLNANGAGTTYGEIVPSIWEAATVPAILTNRTLWPGINISNNDSTDPGFNATLVTDAADSMVHFVNTCWAQGTGLNDRPFVWRTDPFNLFANVASNWAATQGYPVQENLRYSNTGLQHAGTDGKALGDLNWFPEQLTAVSQKTNSMPTQFALSQNYPNPFNPTTMIEYSIPQNSFVTLKVYNVLGQEVASLVNQERQSGSYVVNFDASRLSSGMYFYKIQAGSFTLTKKMLLLK
jgi:hypothetical protein